MKKTTVALASAIALAGMAFAAGENITIAAQDTSKIPELVKSLEGQKGSDFAADVISAMANMPGNPSKKVRKMADAAEAFLGAVPDGEIASLLANMTANVPFASLPAWVDCFKGAVDTFTKDMPDADYDKLVNDVMAKINKLGDTSDADKTVISAFALKLLARGSTEEEKTEWLGKVALPASYRDQVKAAMPGVFSGNYAAVLGPETKVVKASDRIVEPGSDAALVEQATATETTPIGVPVIEAAQDREGVERPEPLVGPGTGTGTGDSKPTVKPKTEPKPPVPPPYKGQF